MTVKKTEYLIRKVADEGGEDVKVDAATFDRALDTLLKAPPQTNKETVRLAARRRKKADEKTPI